nr:hypothetical protein [Tanacetum cinerariifolium]
KGKSHVESFTGYKDLSAEFEDYSKNNINEVNAAGITYSDDVGAEADFNNLETSITVSPILTTRVHKDHPVIQIIGDLSLATQTRSMTRVAKDQDGLSQMFNDDFHNCMFACFLSQEEPKRVHQALKDPSWIEAMQEEILQFKMQKDEEIDYEEVFAPVARIESIRIFLAYASFMGFMVYQIDVKSAFLYGTIEEEVYVCQPPGFKDPDHPDKVYKVVNALYGLHQAPRAWECIMMIYILSLKAKFNLNVAFLLKTKEHIKEEESRALKRLNETPVEKAAKREDLKALWSLVKERFSTTKPKNFSDDFLLVTLGAMFEKPDIHAQI